MPFAAEKTMFMIYRDTTYTDKYMVCYFTELDEHNKEREINKAFSGEFFFDGFIKNSEKTKAKAVIAEFLEKLNNGEKLEPTDIENALSPYLAR